MKRKLCAFLTMLVFLVTLLPANAGFAAPVADDDTAAATDKVDVIVVLDGAPVLAQEVAKSMGARAYLDTKQANHAEQQLRQQQAKVLQQIATLDGNSQKASAKGPQARAASASIQPKFTYTNILNGFCITVPRQQIKEIEALSGVQAVHEAQTYSVQPPSREKASATTTPPASLDDMQVEPLHAQGIKGQGTVIAIIDSELDIQHEMFAGEVEQPRLSKNDIARQLENGTLNIDPSFTADDLYHSSKLPLVFNYATQSTDTYTTNENIIHGSHVSGLAVGRQGTLPTGEKFDGVAPEAQLIFMGESDSQSDGHISDDVVLAGLEDATRLKVDAVNMSFGADNMPGFLSYYSSAITCLRGSGIFVAASAGNAGTTRSHEYIDAENIDYSTSGTPDSDSALVSVASSDGSSYWSKRQHLQIEGSKEPLYYARYNKLSLDPSLTKSYHSVVYCGNGLSENYKGKDMHGKIALIDRGKPFKDTMRAAAEAGAEALIIIHTNDVIPENILDNVLPVLIVNHTDGQRLKPESTRVLLDQSPATDFLVSSPVVPSDFTSWGTTYDLDLKPDITAPGGNIYSAVPKDNNAINGYELFSGTSMASPNLAGTALLLRQYIDRHPEQYPNINQRAPYNRFLDNLLMSTATVLTEPNSDVYASPRQQGAGLVNLDAATHTPVILLNKDNQTKLALREITDHFTLQFDAYNFSNHPVTYDNMDVSVLGESVNANGKISKMKTLHAAKLDAPQQITVPAGEKVPITIKVTLDAKDVAAQKKDFPNGFYIDGFVRLHSNDNRLPSIGLPYSGFYGNWQKAPSLDQPYFSEDTLYGGTRLCSTKDNVPSDTDFLGDDGYLAQFDPEGSYPTQENEAYCAISPNNDGTRDTLNILLSVLRTTYCTELSIQDASGKTVYTESLNDYVAKSLSYLNTLSQDAIDNLPDGQYQLKLEGCNAYNPETAPQESITMDFAVDRQAPAVSDWQMTTDGKQLQLHANDNHALMGVVIRGQRFADGKDATLVLTTEQCKDIRSNTFSVDISQFAPDSVSATVYDFALNHTTLCGPQATRFVDVSSDDWFAEAVNYAYDHQLMTGIDHSHFFPLGKTTRGQFITTLWRMAGSPDYPDIDLFEDVPSDAYYSDAVVWAVDSTLSLGTSKTTFSPDDVLSREQMATIFYRLAGLNGKDTLQVNKQALDGYSDANQIQPWARDAMCWCVDQQLLHGVSSTMLAPQLDTNRAQLATVLMQYQGME